MTSRSTADVPPILTSSWRAPLPAGHVRIGISRGTPRGMPAGYRRYPRLAPGKWFASVTPVEYSRLYTNEILAPLDPGRVVQDLREIAGDNVPVPSALNRPGPATIAGCHPGVVSAWLHDNLGLEVFELGHEVCGCGWKHPKLHSTQRP